MRLMWSHFISWIVMGQFFQTLQIDKISFWLGFLSGALILWLARRIIHVLPPLRDSIQERLKTTQKSWLSGFETKYRNELLLYTQNLHIASTLFSLNEIIITPKLLAPPIYSSPEASSFVKDTADLVIPYMPEWPELGAKYGVKTITLKEALLGGSNIILIGHPGCGKTTSLAYLASKLISGDTGMSVLNNRVPILLHVSELDLDQNYEDDLFVPVSKAVHNHTRNIKYTRLNTFINKTISSGNALLLLDGLDELPNDSMSEIVNYVSHIIQSFPNTLIVVTADTDNYDGFTSLGFIPVPIASWNDRQRNTFIHNWSSKWEMLISDQGEEIDPVDLTIIKEWMKNGKGNSSPLEITLTLWGLFAGDMHGSTFTDSIDAYLNRISRDIPGAIDILAKLSANIQISNRPVLPKDLDYSWNAFGNSPNNQIEDNHSKDLDKILKPEISKISKRKIKKCLPLLVDSRILCERSEYLLGFNHPVFPAYLTSIALNSNTDSFPIFDNIEWTISKTTINFITANEETTGLFEKVLDATNLPLHKKISLAGRWMSSAGRDSPWINNFLLEISRVILDDTHSIGLRTRAMVMLALSARKGIDKFFRDLLDADDNITRQLASLSCGYIKDNKSKVMLHKLARDEDINVGRSACLALTAIGDTTSLDIVADILLQDSDELRRSAAEALSTHSRRGYSILEEASNHEDLLVRRAAVYGLKRIDEDWAVERLKTIQMEETQWIVRDAAIQALEDKEKEEAYIPKLPSSLRNIPWLIAYAGTEGVGISSRKNAFEILQSAAENANKATRLAALWILGIVGEAEFIDNIYDIYRSESGEVKETAFNALWHLSSAGMDVPL